MKQLKYALIDIKCNRRMYVIFFIQMIAVIFLLYNIFNQMHSSNEYLRNTEELIENSAYISIDSTTSEHLDYMMNKDKNVISKLNELYQFILEKEKVTLYSSYYYYLNEFIDGEQLKFHYINKYYNNISNLKTIKGRVLKESDFVGNENYIPILIGYNLKNKYDIEKYYTMNDPITGNLIKYKVVGVLAYNSTLVPINYGVDDYLNSSIISPMQLKKVGELTDFSELDLLINNNIMITNDRSQLQEIEKKSQELGLFSIKYTPLTNIVEENISLSKTKIFYMVSICIIIVLFSLVGIVTSILSLIKKHTRDYSIHLLCGARIKDILIRISIPILLVEFLALIPLIIFFTINTSTFLIIVSLLVIDILIMIFPVKKLYRTRIGNIIKRSY